MTNDKKAIDLITSAFDDYISGRFLLSNNYSINGVILSSLAIEKYLKAMLLILNGDFKKLHLDNIPKLIQAFDNTGYEVIFKYVDPRFLELLSLGYKFRYYDNIKDKQTIGFATNQVIAELDYFIAVLDQLVLLNIDGKPAVTQYRRAVNENDPRIYDNNFFLNKIDKTIVR